MERREWAIGEFTPRREESPGESFLLDKEKKKTI